MAWEDLGDPQKFEFKKKGDSLCGKLIDIKQTKEYESKVYTLMDADRQCFYFFGCYKLDSVLPALQGRYIKITYKGKAKIGKGQTLRDFDIAVWSNDEGTPPDGFAEDVPF